jgi:hypothetical protein
MVKQQQLENIQIDYGVVYNNYGETDTKQIGPSRGGGEFKATASIRDIEYDGAKGKTKGMQVVDSVDAVLSVTILDTSLEAMALAMPWATYDSVGKTLTCDKASIGVITTSKYLKNTTMFCKTAKGEYRKITLFNTLAENEFSLAAKPKAEGEIALEIYAHWDDVEGATIDDLFKVETVATIA